MCSSRSSCRLIQIRSQRSHDTTAPTCRFFAHLRSLATCPPDIEWVEYTLRELTQQGREWDCFSLLRPTSPFRTAETIGRAWTRFTGQQDVDSLRAVERCAQHPGKMWEIRGDRMVPLMPRGAGRATLAQHAVPGPAARVRAECVARDRLDACGHRAENHRGRSRRSLSDRRVRRIRYQRPVRLDRGGAPPGRGCGQAPRSAADAVQSVRT